MAVNLKSALALLVAMLLCQTPYALKDNVITQWINATQSQVATVGIQSHIFTKYYGLIGLAAYRAIEAGGAPAAALAAFAGHTIVSASFPWSQGSYDVLISKQVTGISPADLNKAEAVAVPIAVALLKERAGDETTRWARFKPAAPGTLWQYQFVPDQKYALYPQLANAKPFVVPGPRIKAITSNQDASNGPVFNPIRTDYGDTFELGSKGSAKRTKYQADSAFFWAQGANTSTIGGQWLDIAKKVLPDSLSLKDIALFYARAGAAAYDASIAAWQLKYSRLAWRPVTAFRAGYPGFKAVPDWTALLTRTPPHPEYPSGHQATVGALLHVIATTLGTEKVAFSIGSEGAPWLGERKYMDLRAAAVEVGNSRLWGGVHFNKSNVDGLAVGELVAQEVVTRLGPKPINTPTAGRKMQ